jgi:hypothetical protein
VQNPIPSAVNLIGPFTAIRAQKLSYVIFRDTLHLRTTHHGSFQGRVPAVGKTSGGNVPRTYLEWTDRPDFVIGAPVVPKQWGLSVSILGTAGGRFAFVKLAAKVEGRVSLRQC